MINCFLVGCLVIVSVELGIGHNMDKIMIGNVMLFIPTLAIVNGAKDIFYRDIITGIYRIIEGLLTGVAVAFGFGLSIILLGGML